MSKTVLITGASRGIGHASALAFAKAGYHVAINYLHSKQQAQELVKELLSTGVKASAFRADVSDQTQVEKMMRDVYAKFQSIDVLINNAGIAQQKLFTDITTAEWQRMFAVNVDGIFYVCQNVLPHMIARHSGKIINISSIWGMVGSSCEVHYSASKAAVIGLTKALAKELGPSNIQVNCVAPGIIDTDMNANLDSDALSQLAEETPIGRLGKPEEIAGLLLYLASDKASFITGQVISPNGGFVIC